MSLTPLLTSRLCIRQAALSDAAALFSLGSDPSVQQHMPDLCFEDEDEVLALLAFELSSSRGAVDPSLNPCSWVIVLRETNTVIGHIGLSPYRGACEVGYAIASTHVQRGFATEALQAFTMRAHDVLVMPEIFGFVTSENIGSRRVLEKAGFQHMDITERLYQGTRRVVHAYVHRPPHQ